MPWTPKTLTCASCEEEFTQTNYSQRKYCSRTLHLTCPTCGKNFETVCNIQRREWCSSLCASKDPEIARRRAETSKKKYGVENVMQSQQFKEKVAKTQKEKNGGKFAFNTDKQRKTMEERYGGPSPMYSPELRKKVEETQRKNNGGVFAFNTPKQRETMIERYGSPGILGNPEKYKEHEETMLQRHGVRKISQDPVWQKRILDSIIKNNGVLFGNKTVSKINKNFANKLEELNIPVSFEHIIRGNSFDLFYEPSNLLIEINPTVTHNSTLPFPCLRDKCEQPCNKNHAAKNSDYHYKRALLAMAEGYKLFQIYDWDNPEIIIEMIKAKAGRVEKKLSASKLTVKLISQREANAFLNVNHIQGGSKQQNKCYGLFTKEGELVVVMTFSPPRFTRKYDYELNRFATKIGYQVYGGASKIFNHFVKEENPESILSYVDFNHTTSKTTYLNHLGFVEKDKTGPSVIWSKLRTPKIVKQTSLNAVGADRLLKTNYGKDYSNEEIMLMEGYVRIYTAGNRVFVWEKPANDNGN